MNRRNMGLLGNNPDTEIKITNVHKNPCVICLKGKQHRLSFKLSKTRAADQLELIHTDLCGPMETALIGKSRYILTFLNDYTKKVFVYFLQNKNQVSKTFENFKALVENQREKR